MITFFKNFILIPKVSKCKSQIHFKSIKLCNFHSKKSLIKQHFHQPQTVARVQASKKQQLLPAWARSSFIQEFISCERLVSVFPTVWNFTCIVIIQLGSNMVFVQSFFFSSLLSLLLFLCKYMSRLRRIRRLCYATQQ